MRKSPGAFALAVSLVLFNAGALCQNLDERLTQVRAVQQRSETRAAFSYVDEHRDQILHEWAELTEENAPSGQEKKRAAYVFKLLKKLKLDELRYDGVGNLITVRKGTGGGPRVVFDAHLDTVFQPGLDIDPKIRDGRIYAPGVGDDTRNIEALLASLRALDRARVRTKGDLVFVFTVDEERNLGGAEHFVSENKGKFDYYVALDGGHEGFTYGGIGINWYKHHFVGPGGHTRSRTPPYSATLPLARAVARIYELEVPADPPSNINVGMLGAGEVVNAKAADAWFTLDLRSMSNEVMAELESQVAQILKEEAERAGMTVRTELLSASPAARLPGHRESALVRTAEAVHLAMGFRNPPITETGSNNSSAALREGIPSISTGAGQCGDAHALTEWCDIESFYTGTKKVILLELALAQLSE